MTIDYKKKYLKYKEKYLNFGNKMYGGAGLSIFGLQEQQPTVPAAAEPPTVPPADEPAAAELLSDLKEKSIFKSEISIFESEIKEIEETIKETDYSTLLVTLKVYHENKKIYTKAKEEKQEAEVNIRAAEAAVTEKAKQNQIVKAVIAKVEKAKNALEKKAEAEKAEAKEKAKEKEAVAKAAAAAVAKAAAATAEAAAEEAATATAEAAAEKATAAEEVAAEAEEAAAEAEAEAATAAEEAKAKAAAAEAATAAEEAATAAEEADAEEAAAEAATAAKKAAKAAATAEADAAEAEADTAKAKADAAKAEARATKAKTAAEDKTTETAAQADAEAAAEEAKAKAAEDKATKAKTYAAKKKKDATDAEEKKAAADEAKTAVLAKAKIPNLVEEKFNADTTMEIAKLTTQSELRILKNTLLGPYDNKPNLEIPKSEFKKYMQQRIMILIGGEAEDKRKFRLDVITFKLDNILNEIIVFFNGIQILKEYEEISELLEQLEKNNYKKIISDFKNNTSSLIRQMPDKGNDLSNTLDTWLKKKNYIKKDLDWDSYKKAKPVLEKVEQLRGKIYGFGEYYSFARVHKYPLKIYSDGEEQKLEDSFKASFKKAIDELKTPTLDLENTEKLLKNETTKINNQITQMVNFIDDTKNKQYAQKLRYLNNLQTLRNTIKKNRTTDFTKLPYTLENKTQEKIVRLYKSFEIEKAKAISVNINNKPESLDENNPELAKQISDGSKILEQLAIKFSYEIESETKEIEKIEYNEDTVVDDVYNALDIENAGNIFSEKEKKECKTHIRNMVKSVNNRFDEEQVN